MAHFAQLNENNVVTQVIVVGNDVLVDENGNETEQLGIQYLQGLFGSDSIWKQTSYNTIGGIYYIVTEDGSLAPASDQSKAFRKNYAGTGYHYDVERDAFINSKPELPEGSVDVVVFDEFACLWLLNPQMPAPMEVFRV